MPPPAPARASLAPTVVCPSPAVELNPQGGTLDLFAAVQSSANKTYLLRAGVYTVNTSISDLACTVCLIGDSRGSVTIRNIQNNNRLRIFSVPAAQLRLEKLTIDGMGQSPGLELFDRSKLELEDVTIRNCRAAADERGAGIDMRSFSDTRMTNVRFEKNVCSGPGGGFFVRLRATATIDSVSCPWERLLSCSCLTPLACLQPCNLAAGLAPAPFPCVPCVALGPPIIPWTMHTMLLVRACAAGKTDITTASFLFLSFVWL